MYDTIHNFRMISIREGKELQMYREEVLCIGRNIMSKEWLNVVSMGSYGIKGFMCIYCLMETGQYKTLRCMDEVTNSFRTIGIQQGYQNRLIYNEVYSYFKNALSDLIIRWQQFHASNIPPGLRTLKFLNIFVHMNSHVLNIFDNEIMDMYMKWQCHVMCRSNIVYEYVRVNRTNTVYL